MSWQRCAILSLLETAAIQHRKIVYPSNIFILFILLFLSQYLAVFLYNIFIYPFYSSPLRHLPGPKDGNFFFGQTLKFLKAEGPNDVVLTYMRQFPDAPLIRYLHLGNTEWLLVNSVRACKELVQTKCYSFEKPEYFRRIVGEIVGIGLVNAEGEEHRRQRKLLAGPFSVSNIKKLVPLFNDKSRDLSRRIEEQVQEHPNAPIEVNQNFAKTTLDIIGTAALGVELCSLSTSGSTFSNLYAQILDQPPIGQLISAINMFVPIRNWVPLKANRDFQRANGEVRRLLRETIRKRKKAIFGERKGKTEVRKEFTEEGSKDLLTFMIYEKSEGANKWSEDDILGHLLNFMAAGHETTAGALTWLILALCLHPNIQSRLREEVKAQIPHSNPPSFTELENLSYMNNVLKEALRCYSPSTLIPRTPSHTITFCDTVIPVGTTILLNPSVLHLNPDIWGSDAESFNPDRHASEYINENEQKSIRDPFALEAFSNGPRICIGRMFAMLEMKSVLVELLRKFEMKRGWGKNGERLREGEEYEGVGDEDEGLMGGVKLQNFITLRSKDGVWVKFRILEA
ncbi:cytochrome P450 [Lindgomyces ingoldianus]|uniref:Cytochrome P450 n=1 Tax=Lindgomyces ingoldianus TaxID=673940 RepID=A0ACB6QWJ1_9PLEO|nr:cytochrome P450 [Lindgomyces ingoldianus]KAF2471236.1 cytochrome P450 [Lindgomyces ingoldianus]